MPGLESGVREMMDEKLENSIQGLFMRATHAYFQKNFQLLNKFGLHPGQPPILWHLFREEGLSQKEIANRVKVKPPTVNVSLQRLEKADYICRRQDERDQRVSRIYLTEKGRDVARRLEGMMEKNEVQMTRNFTEAEICLLSRFLKQLIENIESIEITERIKNDFDQTHSI